MKKRAIPFLIVLILGVIGYTLFHQESISIITMDINPSIKIELDQKEKVRNISAFNEDAKDILPKDYKNKTLDETFEILISNLIDKGYVEDHNIDVILHTEGTIEQEEIAKKVEYVFGKQNVHTEIIVIEKITKEDQNLAKKYHISPAKASYIQTIMGDISIDNLVEKSVSELNETKKTGKYCDKEYVLEGGWCLKEKSRMDATSGEICPSGYAEYEGKCYEEMGSIESTNYICQEGFQLSDDKCISVQIYDALGRCDSGDYNDGYCVTKKYTGDAKEYCRLTPETDLLYNGRCLGRKPTINGGCINGDQLINGYCYDTSASSGYKADWVCPDGSFITNPDGSLMYEDKKCYTESKTEPTSYYCEENAILNGTKCELRQIEDAEKERVCPSGYTKVDDGSRCLNFNKEASKENGLVCALENARLKGDTCILYDIVEAK